MKTDVDVSVGGKSLSRVCLCMLLVIIVVTVPLGGCASSSSTAHSHPGAANATDSQIYDTLVSIQASIEQAKADFGSLPAAKAPLNKIIASYNAAQDAYRSYHQLAMSGHAPDATNLTSQVFTLVNDLAALNAQFGKKKGGNL